MNGSLHSEAVDGRANVERGHRVTKAGDVGAWALTLAVLALCLCAAIAGAQSVPNVVMSQVTTLALLPAGGALAGSNPSGSSMAVDSAGNLYVSTTYGGTIVEFSPGSTTATTVGKFSNPGGIAIDPAGNLYIGQAYSATVIKVPLVSGAFAISSPSSSTPTCTGNDTVECALAFSAPISGVVSMAFDSAGDLFFASENGGTDPNTIFECTAACLVSGTPAPAVLFAESSTATTEGSSTALENLGGIAVDPWGDVFFADSLLDVTNASNGYSYQSSAKELVYSGGAYSSTPTTLYTLTNSSPGNYDDQLDGIAVDSNGTVYYGTQYDGIFAFPNNKGTVTTTTSYMVSNQGAKILATDGHNNFYVVTYSGGDTAMLVGVGALTATASSVGSNSTATFTTILNDEGCSPAPVVNFSALEGSTSTTEFAAATTGSCSTVNSTGASYKTTLTFTPAFGGTRTASVTATEAGGPGSNGGATATGFATGQLVAPTFSPAAGTYTAVQTVNIYDQSPGVSIYYTTDNSTPTTSSTLYAGPLTVGATETINAIATSSATGVTTSAVSTGAYTINLPVATPTLSPAGGSYAAAQTVTISDSNSAATIYYTTNGTAPTTSSSMYSGPITVSSSAIVQAIAVASGSPNSNVGAATYLINSAPSGAALSVVMTQNTQLGTFDGGGALTGGSPSGNSFAVDSGGNLITGNSYGGKILEFAAGATTFTELASYSNPGPVAIDAAGNLYIASTYGGTIAKIPNNGGVYAAISTPGSGTPACKGSDTAECVLPFSAPANGIATMTFDASGDLFLTTTSGTPNPNSIVECTAACVKTGSPAPTVVYAESTTATPEGTSNTALWFMGGIAVDPWGNVFFADSLMDSGGAGSGFSYQSALKELTFSGGAYSTTPTTLYTLTDSSPGNYDDQLVGVATDANGTVYFSTEYDAVYGFPNNKGAVNTTTAYTVSTQGGKILTLDSKGNAYVATYSNSAGGDVAIQIAIDNIALPNAAVPGSSSVSNVTTILNDGACSTNPLVAFSATENGAASTEFSANTTGKCASTPTGGSSFPTAVNFNPTVAGTHTGVLTAQDTVDGGIGAAIVSGVTSGSAAGTPTFSPAAGTYTSVQTVTISDATPGAVIYYTTDGSTPSPSSTKYTGAISVTQSEAIKAIAAASGLSNSAVGTAAYTLNLPLTQTPVISVASGTYTSAQTVKITDGTVGAKMYYTIDGSTPTASSTQYKTPLTVSASETLNVIAAATGYAPSNVATATYTINLTVDLPTFSPAAGTFTTIQKVTLADTTAGAAIYYTTDGSTPTTSSTLYSGPIAVNSSETINAIGAETGFANSSVASAIYTLNLPPTATPTISLGTGTYTVSQPVTISDTTAGAVIYYTTNGSTPTTSSTVYSKPLTLSATETLKAIAAAVGYSPSPVATSTYTVNLMPAGFALAVNPSSLTIPSTASYGLIQLTVQPQGGFTGAVALSCSGLPSGAACGFSSSPVNLTNYNQPQVITVTISTGQTAMLHRRGNPLMPEATLALAICFFGFRKRRGIQIALLAVISVLGVSMISGCGSSGPGTSTSTVTVNATAGSLSTKTTVSLTMNH